MTEMTSQYTLHNTTIYDFEQPCSHNAKVTYYDFLLEKIALCEFWVQCFGPKYGELWSCAVPYLVMCCTILAILKMKCYYCWANGIEKNCNSNELKDKQQWMNEWLNGWTSK